MNRQAENEQMEQRILLVDIGNTNLKWAWAGEVGTHPPHVARHSGLALAELPAVCWGQLRRPQRVVIANVAGPVIEGSVRRWMEQQWGVIPEFIRSRERAFGVINAYAEPETLGVDRWLTLIAVQRRRLTPACILDCGTAITLDLIDGAGGHRGGLILPGFRLMRQAILGSTSIRAGETEVSGLLARDTAGAITLGGVQAVVSLVKRVLGESAEELGERPRLLLTGGDAHVLKVHLQEPLELKSDLVMSGLSVVAGRQN